LAQRFPNQSSRAAENPRLITDDKFKLHGGGLETTVWVTRGRR
jgi:hypothetical protein